MKKFHLQLVLLLFAVACHSPRNNDHPQLPSIVAVDTLWQPTSNAKLDSLLQLAAVAKQDTVLAQLYYDIGEIYVHTDYQKAKEYYLKLKTLSEELNWNQGLYLFAPVFTDMLNGEGLMDSSIVIHQQVLELAKKEMNEERIARILANIGISYHYKKWFETALNYYSESLSTFERLGEKYRMAHLYYVMAFLYEELNMQDENLMYCERALNILNEKPDTMMRANALNHYAIALAQRNQFEMAENSLMEALRITTLHNSMFSFRNTFSNLGYLSLLKFDLNNAEMYTRKALDISEGFGDVEGICIANRILSKVELIKRNFAKSEEYAKKALKFSIDNDLTIQKIKCYQHLANLSTALHDFRNHQLYEAKADSIEITLTVEKTRIYAKELEAKYETVKKELEISTLEEERRLMIWLGITGGALLLLALAASLILWRWTVQKRQLAETRILQLEQEKQLIATQSVLDGETAERARLARDLHDGLGSLLTGAKLRFLEMKQGAKLEYEDLEHFENALMMLDRSTVEMRRVAHHLMPDSLTRFGLKPAVSDFCSNLPSVEFIYYGDESRLEPKLEVLIYRCIHELVNNALKHAGDCKIIVQIMQRKDSISFTVQDDGCGFDPSAETKGMGLHNIRSRVAAYNGIIHIDSRKGVGTETNVELKIENEYDQRSDSR